MSIKLQKLWGTAVIVAAFFFLSLSNATAQTTACVTPPTCEDMGYVYNPADCSSVSLRCPFDLNKAYCTFTAKVGDILYSDLSSSPVVLTGKKPIGVIFDMAKRLAIGLNYEMKTNASDPNAIVENVGLTDGKLNTQLLMAYAKSHQGISMPAAEYCSTYTTPGTKAGDWFLLSASEQLLLDSKWEVIKETMTKLGVSLKNSNGTDIACKLFQNSSQYGNSHTVIIGDMNIKMPHIENGYPTLPVISF